MDEREGPPYTQRACLRQAISRAGLSANFEPISQSERVCRRCALTRPINFQQSHRVFSHEYRTHSITRNYSSHASRCLPAEGFLEDRAHPSLFRCGFVITCAQNTAKCTNRRGTPVKESFPVLRKPCAWDRNPDASLRPPK
jgi:hypothetical protein